METVDQANSVDRLDMMADIVSAYVANNNVPATDLPGLIASTHAALARLGPDPSARAAVHEKATPAQIKKSIGPDTLISFLDGKPYKTLKRHISTSGLGPESYRERFGLPRDYPMVSASYSRQRSQLARDLGLGQGGRPAAKETTPAETATDGPEAPASPREAGGGPAKGRGGEKGQGRGKGGTAAKGRGARAA